MTHIPVKIPSCIPAPDDSRLMYERPAPKLHKCEGRYRSFFNGSNYRSAHGLNLETNKCFPDANKIAHEVQMETKKRGRAGTSHQLGSGLGGSDPKNLRGMEVVLGERNNWVNRINDSSIPKSSEARVCRLGQAA